MKVPESGDLFEKKELVESKPQAPRKSRLTEQLDNFAAANNPFMDYAKFDGKIHVRSALDFKYH